MKPFHLVIATTASVLAALPAFAQDQLVGGNLTVTGGAHIDDDSVIDGYLCVGNVCSNSLAGQTFNDNYLMKLHYTRVGIEFNDSSGSTYPSRHWGLLVNDIEEFTAGGIDRMSFHDFDAGTTPFTVEGGAPNNALWVDDSGKIGVGTMVPQSEMHLVGPSFPALRLQQDTSGGNPAATWRVQGNHNEFSIVNSAAAFVIETAAPFGAFRIANSGNVGLGTVNPLTGLHLQRNDGSGAVLIEETSAGTLGQLTLRNNGITFFTLEDTSIPAGDNTGRAWNFQNQAGTFRVTTAPGGPGEIEMQMDPNGDMYIKGQLYTGTGGATTTCVAGCDAVFDEGYELPTFADQMAEIRAGGHLPAVGPTPEDGPHNLSQMVGGTLNELEKAYLYIDRINNENAALRSEVDRMQEELAELDTVKARLAQIEALLAR